MRSTRFFSGLACPADQRQCERVVHQNLAFVVGEVQVLMQRRTLRLFLEFIMSAANVVADVVRRVAPVHEEIEECGRGQPHARMSKFPGVGIGLRPDSAASFAQTWGKRRQGR